MKKFGIQQLLLIISALCGLVLVFYILNHSVLLINSKILLCILVVLLNVILYFLFKIKNDMLQNIIIIVSGLMILAQIVGVNYIIGFDMIFEHMSTNTNTNVIVFVKKDSELDQDSLKGKKIGIIIGDDIGYFLSANQHLNSKIEIRNTYKQLFDDLENGKLDGVMTLEQNYAHVYKEYRDLDIKTRPVKSFSVYDIYADLRSDDVIHYPFVVYVGGNIEDNHKILNSESNVNFLVAVNPIKKKMLFVLIPKDALFYNKCTKLDHPQKISVIGINGISCSMKTISESFNIKLNYFLYFNLDSIKDKSLFLKFAFNNKDSVKKEYDKKLTSEKMMILGKFSTRMADIKLTFNDWYHLYGRNGTEIVKNLIKNINMNTLLTNYNQFVHLIRTGIYTSFTSNELKLLVKRQIEENTEWGIELFSLKGSESLAYSEHHPEGFESAIEVDKDSIDEAILKINEILKTGLDEK